MKQLTITNRPTKKEYLQLKKLYLEFFNETITQEVYDPKSCAQRAIKTLKRDINNYHLHFWLVKDPETDELVGFAKARTYGDGVGLFCHIYVKPEYRLKRYQIGDKEISIAHHLNGLVKEWFIEENCHTIEIETSKEKPQLHRILFHQGYEIVREFPDAYVLQKRINK